MKKYYWLLLILSTFFLIVITGIILNGLSIGWYYEFSIGNWGYEYTRNLITILGVMASCANIIVMGTFAYYQWQINKKIQEDNEKIIKIDDKPKVSFQSTNNLNFKTVEFNLKVISNYKTSVKSKLIYKSNFIPDNGNDYFIDLDERKLSGYETLRHNLNGELFSLIEQHKNFELTFYLQDILFENRCSNKFIIKYQGGKLNHADKTEWIVEEII